MNLQTQKCGIVALIGAPNAGKSTLTNTIVGQKVSIVTHKVQTTRQRVTGIALHGQTQLILFDTPGLFEPKARIERAMVEAAYSAAGDADLRLFIVDVAAPIQEQKVLDVLNHLKTPFAVVLNKVDRVDHSKLLERAANFNHPRVDKVFMISALNHKGVDDVIQYVCGHMPESPWLYPEEDISDMSERLLAAEITREQVIFQLHQELPYATYVETEAFEEFRNGDVKISQVIVVAREGQKAIVLGQKGEQIKKIRQSAQHALQQVMDRKVHLFLHVKVKENWQDKSDFYALTGLNYKA